MVYTKEEIEKYLEILRSYNTQSEENDNKKVRCRNCQSDSFFLLNQVIIFVILVG